MLIIILAAAAAAPTTQPSDAQITGAPILDISFGGDVAFNISVGGGSPSSTRPGSVFGPDVSHYQGTVRWRDVEAAGASFAFAKASEGLHTTDDQFSANWAGMRAVGIKVRGAYHFGHPEEDALAQVRHFLSQIPMPLAPGDLLVLDIEAAGGKSPSEVATWTGDFLGGLMKATGLPASRVLVYTGAWFWNSQAGGSSIASEHPLWVSGYVSAPPMPKGWAGWTYWQYTDKATDCGPSGSAVDCSVFHGSLDQLHARAGLLS